MRLSTDVFVDQLKPQTGKACLGDLIYRYITADQFFPECLLDCLDLSSEHLTLEIANRIEAAVYIWRKKDHRKQSTDKKGKRSSWGGKVKGLVSDTEKNLMLAQRAENLLRSLRHRFPALPQTALDMNKIQYNKVCHLIKYFLFFVSLRHKFIPRFISIAKRISILLAGCGAVNSRELFEGYGESSL